MAPPTGNPPRRTRRHPTGKRKAGLQVPSEETLVGIIRSLLIAEQAIESNVNAHGQERSVRAFREIQHSLGFTFDENEEISRIIGTFDSRLTESEKRIDRVLARLGVE